MKWQLVCLTLMMMGASSFGQSLGKLKPSDFKTASSSKPCHTQIYEQWTSSTHSKAFEDPVYQVFLRRVTEKSAGRLTQFCVSCHAPLATVTHSIPEKLIDGNHNAALLDQAVSCEFCHTISGKEVQLHKLSLGAYLFPRVGQTEILYGRHPDAKAEAHPTQPSSFLLSSELCGTCHRFAHPASGRVIQDTYEEWKRSPYAQQGTRCQDCHMPAYAGNVAEGGKERPELHAHVFIGGHTEMIRKAAVINLDAGWSKRETKDALAVTATVTNKGAGHLIPTGIPGIREMWLEVSVFNGQQSMVTEKRALGQELFDAGGKLALPWDAVRLGKDTDIGPKEARKEKFTFKLTSPSEVRVEAKLLERLVSEMAAKYAGIAPTPPMPMAEASVTVP